MIVPTSYICSFLNCIFVGTVSMRSRTLRQKCSCDAIIRWKGLSTEYFSRILAIVSGDMTLIPNLGCGHSNIVKYLYMIGLERRFRVSIGSKVILVCFIFRHSSLFGSQQMSGLSSSDLLCSWPITSFLNCVVTFKEMLMIDSIFV